MADLAAPRWFLAATTGPDGRIYAIGGRNSTSNVNVVDTVYAYTAATTVTASALVPIADAAAARA